MYDWVEDFTCMCVCTTVTPILYECKECESRFVCASVRKSATLCVCVRKRELGGERVCVCVRIYVCSGIGGICARMCARVCV